MKTRMVMVMLMRRVINDDDKDDTPQHVAIATLLGTSITVSTRMCSSRSLKH